MKKSILLGCIAACTLSATSVFAEIIKPTSDELKSAFVELLNTQTKTGTLFDLSQMSVVPQGNDFDLVLPAYPSEKNTIQTKTVHLTYAGEFNNYAQYKVESPFETIQSLFKEVLPDASFSAEKADVTMIWVPAYNLITQNTQNIKGLKLSIPNMMHFSAGSIVSDALIRAVSSDKMDAAGSSDVRNIEISVENSVVTIPSFSYESNLVGSDITPDPFTQMISSHKDEFKYTIPEVQIKMAGAAASMASLSLTGKGLYQNEVLHFDTQVGDIASPTLGAFVPAVLVPDKISIDFDIEGISKDVLVQLAKRGQTGTFTDDDVPLWKDAIKTGILKLNLLEAKNTFAGIAVSGTVRSKLKNVENVKTFSDIQENLEPVVEAKIVITNLDKISPEPTVDQAQCERATNRLKAIDMSDPSAAIMKETAEMQREISCTPQGGPLDMIRPYLDMNNRVMNADGTTTDTFVVTFEDDVLTVNGNQVR